jgi:hypothetical protein
MFRSRARWLVLACVAVLAGAPAAQAVPIAAAVRLSSISPCPSFCGGSGRVSDFASDGGSLATSAAQSLNNAQGDGRGDVTFLGPAGLPILRAEAFSQPNARIETRTFAMRAFDYIGAQALNGSVDILFDGIASAPVVSDARLTANIGIALAQDLDFVADYSTWASEVVPGTPGASMLGEEFLSIPVNAGPQSLPGSVPFDVSPGDRIFVFIEMRARGTRGGSADAFNTFTVDFSDPSSFSALPEPGGLVLLGVGFAALSGVRPRAKASRG